MYAMTAAHATLPIPSYARVTNIGNGRSVIVRINDRGPFHSGRLIDLSYAAAYKLGYAAAGSAAVEIDAITPERDAAARGAAATSAEDRCRRAAAAGAADGAGDFAAATSPQAEPARAIPVDAVAGGIYLQLGAFSRATTPRISVCACISNSPGSTTRSASSRATACIAWTGA